MPTRKGNPRERKAARAASGAAAPKRGKAAAAEQPAAMTSDAGGKGGARRNALFPLGVNYLPLDSELSSWEEWYAGDIAADVKAFQEGFFALVRVFVSWKAIEPQVGQYDEDAIERLADVLEAVRNAKLQAIVTFFADDPHAELIEVPWGKKRDPRTDSYLVGRETELVQKLVQRFRSEKAVFAWDLADEAFCSGFKDSEELFQWAGQLRDSIREIDPDRPITLGADPETLFRATGVDAREAVDLMEFGVSHVTSAYRAYAAEGPITSGPSTYLDSFLLRCAQRNLPILLDDAGVLALDNNVAEEAAYLRTVLWGGLMNRAAGVLARRYRDLETEKREPYFVEPFERLVGIAENDGSPKPAFEELRKFARVAARIDLSRYALQPERAAILVPAERYLPLPSLAGLYDARACLQAFVAAKEAHVPIAVVREGDALDEWEAIYVPSAFNLEDDTWDALSAFVQRGGTIMLSYGGGDAHPAIRELFGMEFLGDGGPRETLSCRVAQADILGAIEGFDAHFPVANYALLSGAGATVVATDEKGSPLLTVNQVGQGRAIYLAAPVERAIAQNDPWARSELVAAMLRTVYGAVARSAGAGAPVECDAPQIEVALFQGETDDVLLLLNHAAEKVQVNLVTERRVASIADVRGGAPVAIGGVGFGVPLEANSGAALRLSYG
jgi:endo-1,4-beta-mannosidase